MAPPKSPAPLWLEHLRSEIRWRLDYLGVTQRALSEAIGVSDRHVSQFLRGENQGSPQFLDAIATAMGMRISVIASGPPSALVFLDRASLLPPGTVIRPDAEWITDAVKDGTVIRVR